MSLCQSIETLAMAYLDDELVAEERRELELHLLSCPACKQHVESERADLSFVRKALVPPAAPPALRVSIQRLLDDEDRQVVRAVRQRWTRFLLPGSAALAAAAALAVFVLARPTDGAEPGSTVAHAVTVQMRPKPLEVQGAATGRWLQEHFEPTVEPPQFTQPGIQLLGARLAEVGGYDAALLRYAVTAGGQQFELTAIVMEGLRGPELSGGTPVQVGRRGTLYLHDANGTPAVTYVDESAPPGARIGYTFACRHLRPMELLQLVVSSDLVTRAGRDR